ncbi:uncharacterized protein LOC141909031 isoform X2 [Tubulanus polymorphus]
MIPMSKRSESVTDIVSTSSVNSIEDEGPGQSPQVKAALAKELKTFRWREEMVKDFKALMYMLLVMSPFAGFTNFWYGIFWCFFIPLIGAVGCPSYTQFAGYVGVNAIYKIQFCAVFGVLSLANLAADIYLVFGDISTVLASGCVNSDGGCSTLLFFSAIYFALHAFLILIGSGLAWAMLNNFQIEMGDIVERYLVQTRNIEKVMHTARNGKLKEKRIAAFELATLAASGDDNKYKIVTEGGLEVLISMILSSDETTREHAVECTAELLTLPDLQDQFIDEGGLRSLTAVLRSSNERLVYEAATALSYIVSETDENKSAVINDHGLEDLCYAAGNSSVACQRIVAGIFLELVFSSDVRMSMSSMNSPAQALITMCQSQDPETQRYALQALELLAIESADMICAQEELLPVLLNLPLVCPDEKLYVLAAKLLLYYAEDEQTCELLVERDSLYASLNLYIQSQEPVVQKVVAKVIYCIIDTGDLRIRAEEMKLDEILQTVKMRAMDRETWDMADQALQLMEGNRLGLNLPELSPMEKIDKLSSKGSHLSIEPKAGTSTGSM